MKAVFHILIAAVGVVAMAAAAGAQTRADIANAIVVKRLVAAGTSDANGALARHFAALAQQYAAEAERDQALAAAFIGNPSRTTGPGVGAQYARMAKLATEWGGAAGAMSTYHNALAAGETAVAPARAAFFDSGGGAPAPTAGELKDLAASARTASEHHDLEEYYVTLAETHEARARKHVAMAQALRAAGGYQRGMNDPASHCDRTVRESREAAKDAEAAAATQHLLAHTD